MSCQLDRARTMDAIAMYTPAEMTFLLISLLPIALP
jgi:hypothetical protein